MLRRDTILRIPRDLETYTFHNRIDMSKYRHNKDHQNELQSSKYIMDMIDQRFEKLKDKVYKLGISIRQFRNMVED
jgi:hypothetical protein